MAEQDGNRQDMLMSEKLYPVFAATEEAQNMDNVNREVVPMPAYVDPNNPAALAGSINMPLADHPVQHSEDFAQGHNPEEAQTMTGAMIISEEERQAAAADSPSDAPREQWTKSDWQKQARAYGLPISGNTDEVQGRVEVYEEQVEADKSMKASDWQTEISNANSANELAELRQRYDRSGASFSTVGESFDARQRELDNPSQ